MVRPHRRQAPQRLPVRQAAHHRNAADRQFGMNRKDATQPRDGTGASPPQSCAVVTTDHRELLSTTHDKLHIDTADCGVPLSAILTSASIHDSQVAIPLAMMTAGRVTNLYDLMDLGL